MGHSASYEMHVHSNNWVICIPKQNESGTLSLGQCVCIAQKQKKQSLLRYWKSRPRIYWSIFCCIPKSVSPSCKILDMLPRAVSSYILEFVSVSDLGNMCLVAKQYQFVRIRRLEKSGWGAINFAILNQNIRLHQNCMDELYYTQLYKRAVLHLGIFT
jgi:hypothetical protein